jgi:hypothetical protein
LLVEYFGGAGSEPSRGSMVKTRAEEGVLGVVNSEELAY